LTDIHLLFENTLKSAFFCTNIHFFIDIPWEFHDIAGAILVPNLYENQKFKKCAKSIDFAILLG